MRAARWAVGLLASTWSLQVVGEERLRRLREAGVPIVYAIWHGDLLPALWWHRGEPTTLLVSRHRDGGRLVRALRGWGYQVVRGSSTRAGAGGLRSLVRVLSGGGSVAVTPDGPRGPARVAKPGAVAAAQHSRAVVQPVATGASSAWRARSWDGFLIPRPFARVRIAYGRPFTVPQGRGELEAARRRLEAELARLRQAAECQP